MKTVFADQRGLVLLVVLSVVALFMALVVVFSADQFTDLELAQNFKDSLQSQYLGNAGVEAAISILSQDDSTYDDLGESDWAKFSESLLLASSYLEDMTMGGTITDECSKLDLNALVVKDTDGTYAVDTFRAKQLYKLMTVVLEIDITEDEFNDLCAAVKDWIDPDDEPSAGGAESEYYKTLDEPYEPKNGEFDTPEEILLVKGMKSEWFYGTEDVAGIAKFVTIGTKGYVNLNTAPKEVLWSLADGITEKMAEDFIDCRPIKNINEWQDKKSCLNTVGLTALPQADLLKIQAMVTIKSLRFSVDITGTMPSGAMMNVRAILDLVSGTPQIVYYKIY